MKLEDLPQFTVDHIQPDEKDGSALISGHLSHVRGMRTPRGYLYRAHGPSLLAELAVIPLSGGGARAPADVGRGVCPS